MCFDGRVGGFWVDITWEPFRVMLSFYLQLDDSSFKINFNHNGAIN
jgi:hypothetical protein